MALAEAGALARQLVEDAPDKTRVIVSLGLADLDGLGAASIGGELVAFRTAELDALRLELRQCVLGALGDDVAFSNSADDAEDLADHGRGRRVVEEGVGLVGGDQVDAALLQHRVADLLHHQSRAKRLAVSTTMVRTPFDSSRSSMALKPGRVSIVSAPLTASS